MGYLSHFNPTGGFADFWTEFRRPNPHRWPVLGVSILLTATLLYSFTQERVVAPPKPPEVTYISTFEPGRTDQQILESNRANQLVQDELRAAEEARAERRKELYRALGRATGLDVEEMEAKIAADEARERAAQERRLAGLAAGAASEPEPEGAVADLPE